MPPRATDENQHFVRGIRTSTAHDGSAYGFSLAVAGSFAALMKEHGEPTWLELVLFLAGSCITFAFINAFATRFFRSESPDEPEVVILLGTALSVISVCVSVGVATGVAYAISGWPAWLLAAAAFTLVYVVAVGAEIGVAASRHPSGGVEGERRRRD
jgi:hypothetical protein